MHCILKFSPRNCFNLKPSQFSQSEKNIKFFSCLLIKQIKNKEINLLKTAVNREETILLSDVHFVASCGQKREYCVGNLNKNCESLNIFTKQQIVSNLINRNYQKSSKMAPILAPTVKLNNGYEMPVLGLGTYELKKLKCENAVREAIKIGYRHIDTAYLYRNEPLIGKILKEEFEKNCIKREEIFLVTKLWNIYHEPKMVKYACKKQMESLQVEYLDLYLMHSPIGYKYEDDEALMPHKQDKLQTNDIDYVDTYKAMEELVSLGWVRSLGLSNFNCQQLERILDNCSIKPVTNQIECHPGLQQRELRRFCSKHNILITAYSPLARPKASKPLPEFYLSGKLSEIAEKYQKTKAQIILRYLIDVGTVPIPKSARPERLIENISIFDFSLTKEEIAVINDIDCGLRLWRNEMAKFHQYWPFNED